jgi:hypothetical protein
VKLLQVLASFNATTEKFGFVSYSSKNSTITLQSVKIDGVINSSVEVGTMVYEAVLGVMNLIDSWYCF